MSRRRVLLAMSLVGVLAGTAAPALAGDHDGGRICINATHDKNNPGPAPICVWGPLGDSARH
jgi:hypothetical protein